MSIPLRACWLTAAAFAPAACGTLGAQEQPAVIAAHTEQSRAELERAASSAMNGQLVTFADDALTRESVLTLERRTPPGPQGRAATGRTLEEPVQFELVLRGARCLLVHARTAASGSSTEARCVPAAAASLARVSATDRAGGPGCGPRSRREAAAERAC